MANFNFTVTDKVSPVVDKLDRTIDAVAKAAERAGNDISDAFERVEEATEQVTRVEERRQRQERKGNEVRSATVRLAKEMADQELFVSQAREMAARATREQSRAEESLNRARGGGSGSGAGGGGRRRGGGAGGVDPGGEALDLSAAFERSAQDIIRQDRHLTNVMADEDRKRFENRLHTQGNLSAAFERTAEDIIRQDRHLTNILRQEDDTRARDERQAQAEVSSILEKGARQQERTERERFAQNRRNRERDFNERVKAANSLVDLVFSSNKQITQAQERQQREQQRYTEQLARDVNRATRVIEIGLLELFFTLHSLSRPISEITNFLEDFLAANIKASAEVEKFSSTLRIASGNTASANLSLQRLLDITTELAAIDTASLIQFSARLQTAGLSAQQAESVIVGVTRRMEEQGKSAANTVRVLEQFVQAINANLITMQDFRPILREYPQLYRDFSEALGKPIRDLDSFRAAAESVGGATEAIVIGLEHVARVARGAELNTINRQLDEFRDRVFVLQAALGDALRPVVVDIIKVANSFLESLENLSLSMRVFLGVTAATGVAIGRITGALVQLGIIGIVGLQIQGAVIQITAMTNSLNAATAAMTGTAVATATLPAHLVSATKAINIITAILPKLAVGFAALAIVIPTAAAVYATLTQHIRASEREYDSFLSTLTSLPDAVMEGTDAVTEQIKQLTEYRNSLIDIQQELVKSSELFDDFFTGIVRRIAATSPRLLAVVPAIGILDFLRDRTLEDRLESLAEQAELTQRNITDLGIAFDIDVSQFEQELKNATSSFSELEVETSRAQSRLNNYARTLGEARGPADALIRVVNRMRDEFDRALDAQDEDQIRSISLAIQRLIDNFINFNKEIDAENITNYNAELIKLDFTIRRLEGAFGRLDINRFVENFGGTRNLNQISNLFTALQTSLNREAELERIAATERGKEKGDTEQEIADEILKINERLSFDLEELERKRDDFIGRIDEEQFNRRAAALNRYRYLFSQIYDELEKRLEKYHERRQSLERSITNSASARRRLVDEQISGLGGLLTSQLQVLNAFSDFVAQQVKVRGEIYLTAEAVNELSKNFLGLTESVNAFRRESDETEVFRFARPTGPLGESGLPRAPRRGRRTPLDPNDLTGEFGTRLSDIEEITNAAVRAANEIERQNERIVRSFSRGVSRSLTDLIFDGESTFQEFLLEFSKTTARVIIQSRLEAEILKRIDDDVTQHRINNIRRVATERARGGLTFQSLTPDAVSGIASGAGVAGGLLSGGAGSIALIGLAIAPFLVRAIQEGFDDTEVNIDGQEVGRVTTNHIKGAIRRGELRFP